jgi:23S rRNA (guanosine2251-2'-O)-methyltransferase
MKGVVGIIGDVMCSMAIQNKAIFAEFTLVAEEKNQISCIVALLLQSQGFRGTSMAQKTEHKSNYDLVYGIHPVIELLKAKRRKVVAIYTTRPEPKAWGQIARHVPPYVKVNHVSSKGLDSIAGSPDHQGVAAHVAPYPYRKKEFNPEKDKFLLLLDRIQDPRNLGAILRTAYAAGVDGVLLSQKASASLTPTTLKAAAGLAEHLQIMLVPSAVAGAKMLQAQGYELYLAALGEKCSNVLTTNFKGPLCIVIGSEGTGIGRDLLAYGTCVQLPQRTPDISYNASVAAGILLFWVGTRCGKLI